MTKIARHAKASLELFHAMIYFAPEAEDRFTKLGLKPGRMSYYAGRSAAMGPVGAGVVAATFYNFNPVSVAKSIPAAWDIASPAEVLDARLDAVDAALHRLLGDEVLASDDIAEAAELARIASEGCSPEGKPLYAGHADLDWPETPHLKLWHALTLLREFRGDGHIAALQQAGISGIQSLVLHSGAGGGFSARDDGGMRPVEAFAIRGADPVVRKPGDEHHATPFGHAAQRPSLFGKAAPRSRSALQRHQHRIADRPVG